MTIYNQHNLRNRKYSNQLMLITIEIKSKRLLNKRYGIKIILRYVKIKLDKLKIERVEAITNMGLTNNYCMRSVFWHSVASALHYEHALGSTFGAELEVRVRVGRAALVAKLGT